MDNFDISLIPPIFITEKDERFSSENRLWQSAPSAAKTENGRIFCVYSGDNVSAGETTDNYTTCVFSDDSGETFNLCFYAYHEHDVRMSETLLFLHEGILYHFWTQSYKYFDGRGGVWCSICKNPDAPVPEFNKPQRLCHGFMADNPTVLKDGTWLFPASVWEFAEPDCGFHPYPEYEKVSLWKTDSTLKAFTYLGGVKDPTPTFIENTVFETENSLIMLFRSQTGIKKSVSFDNGKNWSEPEQFVLPSPSSRFMATRMPSGALLIVTHYNFTERDHLAALLSYDNGETFPYFMMLDERKSVSYPSGNVDKNGRITLAYDRRRTEEKEILLASFTEEDIKNGTLGENSFIQKIVAIGGKKGYL